MDVINLTIVFVVGVICGSFGTLVGGESLILIPLLIFLGLPPHVALGTNRLGITGGFVAGWYKFHRKRMINYRIGIVIAIPALIGSVLGANLVLQVKEEILRKVIAILTIIILAFIIGQPRVGVEKTNRTITSHEYVTGAIGSFLTGTYSGFYGAGAGAFYSYLLILVFGQTFLESAATRKIATSLVSVMVVMVCAVNEVIDYSLGIGLFIGLSIGSYIGAHYSDRIGNVWIRRLFLVIVLTMAIKLLL